MQFKILKGKPKAPVFDGIMPGPRALGRPWERVTVRPSDDGGKLVTTYEKAEAPATGMPHMIPAMGNLSTEEVDFIMEGALKASEYESRHPKREPVTEKRIQEMVQQMWMDYLQQKIYAYEGRSTFGPGGHTQRQSFGGDKHFNHRG